jgi:glycosyltransferase involved in cell wall biosynthesis
VARLASYAAVSATPLTDETNAEFDASVVIVTKDRRADALRAVRTAFAQTARVEVIVIDDGSLDGTADAVAAEFPAARVERFEQPAGCVARRNFAAELARSPYIFSIDDDAEFTTTRTVEQTLADFDDPQLGAVAIPYIDVPRNSQLFQTAPDRDTTYVTNVFRGTAYAIRRDVFRGLNGYQSSFFQQAEEPDLCLRMLEVGNLVRLGTADPIIHHDSPTRDLSRMWFYGVRNEVLFAWQNVPMPYLPWLVMKISLQAVWLGLGVRRPLLFLRGLLSGYAECLRPTTRRRPVPRAAYRLYRRLQKEHAVRLEEVAALLAEPRIRTTCAIS